MADKLKFRRDTGQNWENVNPILDKGEPGLDLDRNIIKIGDGSSPWCDLEQLKAVPEGWVNVKDFGAKGDGVTDDTEAIQRAIDSIISGILFFPEGIYLTSAPLIISNNQTLELIGVQKRSEIINNTSDILVVGDTNNSTRYGIEIKNLTFTGNQNIATNQIGIHVMRNYFVHIINCKFRYFKGDSAIAIYLDGTNDVITYPKIESCDFNDNTINIKIKDCTGALIINSWGYLTSEAPLNPIANIITENTPATDTTVIISSGSDGYPIGVQLNSKLNQIISYRSENDDVSIEFNNDNNLILQGLFDLKGTGTAFKINSNNNSIINPLIINLGTKINIISGNNNLLQEGLNVTYNKIDNTYGKDIDIKISSPDNNIEFYFDNIKYLTLLNNGHIKFESGKGIILTSPSGFTYRVAVADDGTLLTYSY